MKTELWEILVPASNNKDMNFSFEHHKAWDAFVKDISGGVTIMKTAKGQWLSPDGELFIDRMIPCRIACSWEELSVIIDFTLDHYKQEAVLAYKISDDVILRYKNKVVPEPPTPPLSKIIKEGTVGSCPKCGSTEIRWMGFGRVLGCLQPECEYYYIKNRNNELSD